MTIVVLEGISGAGKTTQTSLLRQRLQDSSSSRVATVGEFSNGPLGRLISQSYNLKKERFVRFHEVERFADQNHLLLLAETIAKAEEAYCITADIVVIDRFFDSWLCYALADSCRVGVDERLLREIYQSCARAHVPAAAVTVFLEVEVETAIHRLAARDGFGIGEEDRKRLRVIARNFEDLYARHPVVRLPGDRAPKEVTTSILKALGLPG